MTVAPGTLGLGVGLWFDAVPGQREPQFESVVWFPYGDEAEAQAFAAEMSKDSGNSYKVKRETPL